jgi:hypothetical protein
MGQSRPANNDGLKLLLLDTGQCGHILQFLIELILIIIFRTAEISSRWILSPLSSESSLPIGWRRDGCFVFPAIRVKLYS